jgi:hypothetical protein
VNVLLHGSAEGGSALTSMVNGKPEHVAGSFDFLRQKRNRPAFRSGK